MTKATRGQTENKMLLKQSAEVGKTKAEKQKN